MSVHAEMDRQIDALEAQLGRCDTKASLLLGFSGALAAILVTAAVEHRPPLVVAIVGALAVTALITAARLLLAVVRPHGAAAAPWRRRDRTADRIGHDPASWPHLARLSPEEVLQLFTSSEDHRPTRIAVLARLTAAKHARIGRAVDVIVAGLVLLAVTGALAAAWPA